GVAKIETTLAPEIGQKRRIAKGSGLRSAIHIGLACPERAVGKTGRSHGLVAGPPRNEVDGATDGLPTEFGRGLSPPNLHAFECVERQKRQIDAPQRAATERHAVQEDRNLGRRGPANRNRRISSETAQ